MKFGRLIATLMFAIFILTAGNCQATMPRSEMFLGGLTVYSSGNINEKIRTFSNEMRKIYGEPQKSYSHGFEYNEHAAIYGNNVMVNSIGGGIIESIRITANNGWKTPAGISVGTNISRVFELYGQPDYSKSNDTKTVCVYYPSDFVEFQGKLVPDFGLFIKYNNDSGKISEMYLAYGFSREQPEFEESFPSVVYDISDYMLKTDTPIEDFIKRREEWEANLKKDGK